jgi:hypothetical protein
MGIFFDKLPLTNDAITAVIRDALEEDPSRLDLETESERRASQLQPGGGEFKAGRFLIAVVILVAFVVAAIWTDAAGIDDSSKALYGFATTIMGVIVGLLAGEKTSPN